MFSRNQRQIRVCGPRRATSIPIASSWNPFICKSWDAPCYDRFLAERGLPFQDLVGLVDVREGLRVLDLGCGTGRWTAALAERLPGSTVLGIDASAEMLAGFDGTPPPGVRFEQALIEEMDGQWDLVFSQSSLQWVPDHESLIPKVMSLVAPGGQLVAQVPSLRENPAFKLIASVAKEEPFATALGGWLRDFPVLSVDRYAELLWTPRWTNLTVFEKVFPHVLDDRDAVFDWMSGTSLVAYLERLDDCLHRPFVERYRERLRDIIPNGLVFFPFRRILFAATHPGRIAAEATTPPGEALRRVD